MSTLEFNGDMYQDGYGGEIMEDLLDVHCLKDFRKIMTEFNDRNHQYNQRLFYPNHRKNFLTKKETIWGRKNTIEMTDENYFKDFFSDWTFWKNVSNETIIISTRDNQEEQDNPGIELKPKEQVAINFGHYSGHYKTS